MVLNWRGSERRIGICITERTLAVAAVRGDRVIWSEECAHQREQLADSLEGLLREVRRRGFSRARVFGTVGPASSQVKRLGSGGWMDDERLAEQIVSQNPRRFFLVNGTPIAVTRIERVGVDGGWVGAVDQPLVEAIATACRSAGLRLLHVSPCAAVLGFGTSAAQVTWVDGGMALEATYADRRLAAYRRFPVCAPLRESSAPSASCVAAAVGAAKAGYLVRWTVATDRTRRAARRVAVAAAACVLATAFAFLAPPIANLHRASRDRAIIAAHHGAADRIRLTQRQLATLARVTKDLNSFAARRRSTLVMLAALTVAIEPPAMLVGLQGDTAGVSLSALTPRAADLVAQLDSMPGVTNVRIVGAVVPEPGQASAPGGGISTRAPTTSPAGMERVTIHFALAGPASDPRNAGRVP